MKIKDENKSWVYQLLNLNCIYIEFIVNLYFLILWIFNELYIFILPNDK
jgi:hypothetical protein